ncbi:Uncharacterised protein [Zhongshania aliphaticivorans]|uniref:AbiTii domain-containing protein n=1 Tax=Zhongshania aliphaticivorans TaxID=1470434 RepID=A0A5S9PFR6_9GAMM|nr:response regulator receiver protein [Zhongshania aliphaticivorans]CAA0102811.1 Uncharacterised protein [Zhongshania aliphaticivorans]CAA0113882.1 Uncharacterised protein [Zhongshania aliphaticivorans]
MKLADEIIEILSSTDGVLTEALIKTKVLLHKIGHKELVAWVNKELNGYEGEDQLPDYRIVHAQVLVSATNGAYDVNSHPVPMGHIDKKYRDSWERRRTTHSLAVIENILNSSTGDTLQVQIPMEANGMLGKGLANGYMVQRAWSEIPVAGMANILMQVRSRLLDFILELSSEFSEANSDEEVKKVAANFDASNLFNNAIFGDNATIVLGSENNANISNVLLKNDFEGLSETLKTHGVSDGDVASLKEAINSDSSQVVSSKNEFGPAVRSWMQSMMSKAIDASWQIELGVAGSLLATALNHYYGLL